MYLKSFVGTFIMGHQIFSLPNFLKNNVLLTQIQELDNLNAEQA